MLSNNNLVIDEIIDISEEVRNFLTDPEIEQNIKRLDKNTQTALKKISSQVVSFEKGWISYCLIKIKKDSNSMTIQARIEANAGKIGNKKPYQQAKTEMLASHDFITYNPVLDHFSDFISHLHAVSDSQQKERKEREPLLVHEKELESKPEIARLIEDIDKINPPAGYERTLYPHFFISSDKNKYIRLIVDQSNKLIIPFFGMDRSVYHELRSYSRKINHQLLIVDFYHDWIDPAQTRLIPLGVSQDVDVSRFSLTGNKMRKLRYLVEKFKKSGEVSTEEYHSESHLPLTEMRDLMLNWSRGKKNIIQHTFKCMAELLQKALPAGYRAFLTYHNRRLCTVIVIEPGEKGIYLMDQEFYDPENAPLGHMEYSIAEIIEKLKKENAKVLSLGLTWYPFIFENHPLKNPEGWAWLKEQNNKQTLLSRIFQQGETNYQFKKKFGIVGDPVFAYVPQAAPFSLLFNYWPVFYQNSLTSAQLKEHVNRIPLSANAEKTGGNSSPVKQNCFPGQTSWKLSIVTAVRWI